MSLGVRSLQVWFHLFLSHTGHNNSATQSYPAKNKGPVPTLHSVEYTGPGQVRLSLPTIMDCYVIGMLTFHHNRIIGDWWAFWCCNNGWHIWRLFCLQLGVETSAPHPKFLGWIVVINSYQGGVPHGCPP